MSDELQEQGKLGQEIREGGVSLGKTKFGDRFPVTDIIRSTLKQMGYPIEFRGSEEREDPNKNGKRLQYEVFANSEDTKRKIYTIHNLLFSYDVGYLMYEVGAVKVNPLRLMATDRGR